MPCLPGAPTKGHPDKVCDTIADSILDAHLEQDPHSRVACEVLCKDEHVILAGEITSAATVDIAAVARAATREIGYIDPSARFHAEGVRIQNLIGAQSVQITSSLGFLAWSACRLRARASFFIPTSQNPSICLAIGSVNG